MIWNKVKLVLPVVLGTLGGFFYYNFVGCNGSCAITGSYVNSTLYGSLMGLFLTDWKRVKLLFIKPSQQNRSETRRED